MNTGNSGSWKNHTLKLRTKIQRHGHLNVELNEKCFLMKVDISSKLWIFIYPHHNCSSLSDCSTIYVYQNEYRLHWRNTQCMRGLQGAFPWLICTKKIVSRIFYTISRQIDTLLSEFEPFVINLNIIRIKTSFFHTTLATLRGWNNFLPKKIWYDFFELPRFTCPNKLTHWNHIKIFLFQKK